MISKHDEVPLYIDTNAMHANKAVPEAVGIAIDLITYVWLPGKMPFKYDPKTLAEHLAKALPARGYSEDVIIRNEATLRTFFTELQTGEWVPSPEFFSVTNENHQ